MGAIFLRVRDIRFSTFASIVDFNPMLKTADDVFLFSVHFWPESISRFRQ